MSFIKKLKALSDKVAGWFVGLLAKNDTMVKEAAPDAVDVLNAIKVANNAGGTDALGFVLNMVGLKWGPAVTNTVSAWLGKNIDKVITGVGIAGSAAETQNVSQKIVLICNYLQTLDIDAKGVKISHIAALLAKDLDDSKLSIVEIIGIVTAIYRTA